jgi:hypothetical protein
MDFLNSIDFEHHNGVLLSMINDYLRNDFYDKMLASHVSGQPCLDIGFGTGLLTVLALKHGATSVVAYESDSDRFVLGQYIIDLLGLQQKVHLINEEYNHTKGLHNATVVFTETLTGNLWGEGLWHSMPRDPGVCFLPSQLFLEFYARPVSEAFARGLIQEVKPDAPLTFAPGIDIDSRFVAAVNLFMAKKYQHPIKAKDSTKLEQGIVHFPRQQNTVWGWIPHIRMSATGTCVARYTLDTQKVTINDNPIDFGQLKYRMHIDTSAWSQSLILLTPRVGMQHGTNVMYLDTGHWGPAENPVLLNCVNQNLTVTHNLKYGRITYNLEQQ